MRTDPRRADDPNRTLATSSTGLPTIGSTDPGQDSVPLDATRTFILSARKRRAEASREAGAYLNQSGRFEILRSLDHGAFGHVFLARDLELDREVAIKVAVEVSEEHKQQFVREGRSVAKLDHPNVVPVYDCGRLSNGSVYLVSKFIDRGNLLQRMAAKRLTVAECVAITRQVASALQHAHERQIIHRDLKPANILLDSQEQVYVADFGIAIHTHEQSDSPSIEGTPHYMSPEQFNGESQAVDTSSDLFSLGVILYEMLTGRRPFPGSNLDEIRERMQSGVPEPPSHANRQVAAELDRICLKLLHKRREDRYVQASDLLNDLSQIEIKAAPETTTVWQPHGVFAVLASLVVAVLLAFLFVGQHPATAPVVEPAIADIHRDVAQWILSVGGRFDVYERIHPEFDRVEQIPATPFEITSVDLHRISLTVDAMQRLGQLQSIRHLHLADTDLTDEGLTKLAGLTNLESLWLNYNDLTDVSGVNLKGFKQLRRLNLGWTDITDVTVEAISGAGHLLHLDLSATPISKGAIAFLKNMRHLKVLRLNNTALSDDCVPYFAHFEFLERLEVQETSLSDKAIEKLKSLLPHCKIVH